MSFSQSFSDSYHYNRVADDSSTVFDADTVTPDEVPSTSLPAMPPLPTLTATATATDYLYNNNITISSSPHSGQKESPQSFTSELLRRINSQRSLAMPSTTTATATVYDANTVMLDEEESPATATRSEEISCSNQHQSSSSSSSKKRTITNSSGKRKQLQENSTSTTTKNSSTKRPRRSSRLKRQSQDQSYVDKSDSEVEDENELEDYEPDEAVINQSSSQISTKRQRQNELKWKSKFQELRAFKQLHGHTCVPTSNKQLGKWVSNQRKEYKKFKANKKSQITKERIAMLESIGFEWVAPNYGGSSKNESAWNKRFNELKAYKELHGHRNVPVHNKDNKELGKWVSTQRQEYKKFQANKKSQITSERIDLLNSIDFQWECRPGRPPRS